MTKFPPHFSELETSGFNAALTEQENLAPTLAGEVHDHVPGGRAAPEVLPRRVDHDDGGGVVLPGSGGQVGWGDSVHGVLVPCQRLLDRFPATKVSILNYDSDVYNNQHPTNQKVRLQVTTSVKNTPDGVAPTFG